MQQRIKDIILFKTYAELRAESQRFYLGMLWWLIEPVIYMLIFYFVFSILFQRGTEDFVVFLLTGLVFWQWFQPTVMQCAETLTLNQPLFNQVFVPKFIFPAVVMLKNTAKFGVILLVLILFLVVYGIDPSAAWLAAPLVLAAGGALIAGIAVLMAAITPLVPDLRVLLENGMRALLFMSGIFYDVNSFETPYRIVFQLNPAAVVIDNLRAVLLRSELPDGWQLMGVLAFAFLTGLAGILIMRANESRYAKISH